MASPHKKQRTDPAPDALFSDSPRFSSLSSAVLHEASADLLINYLTVTPNACNAVEVLKKLCTECDFKLIFQYLLSLPYSHWHRNIMKATLQERFTDTKSDELHQIGKNFIPFKSALEKISEGGAAMMFDMMGPLNDLDTGAWDTHDWFFRILHSRRMEGEPTLLFDIPLSIYTKTRLYFEVE